MENVDFDLNRYSLAELLKLFKLPRNFTPEELKQARHIVLAVHPDKSGLDPKYFVFFKKAYELLQTVNSIKHSEHREYDVAIDKDKEKIARMLTDSRNFGAQFNDLFEKYYVKTEQELSGHGEWLKSDADLDVPFQKLKTQSRALTKTYENVLCSSMPCTGLGGYENSNYADLKSVYCEDSVIGVSEEDFRVKYKSIEDLKSQRVKIAPLTKAEGEAKLRDMADTDGEMATARAFNLVREEEAGNSSTSRFWGELLRLKNS
jgi:curved DNA-binding protein CbpA